ncbi:MAG: hypothetical protein ACTSRI_19690 [Promethearchaeota archaeon]
MKDINLRIVIPFLIGAGTLIFFSGIQKYMISINLFVKEGYIIPFWFGLRIIFIY